MHQDQITVTASAVRALVGRQFPAWRGMPVTAVAATGTVNALFHIGAHLVARFPLQPSDEPDGGRSHLESEAAAARELLGRTRFATPEPIAIGGPGAEYPQAWSVQSWIPGTPATGEVGAATVEFARDLAEFVSGLRGIDTAGRTFTGTGRGGDLRSHEDWARLCLSRSAGLLDVARLRPLWEELRELPRSGADVMSHQDLIPGNVLLAGGRLSGVVDVGGFGPADPALDLVAAWHLLDAVPRRVFRANVTADDLQWRRGMAWAFVQAIGLVWYYRRSVPAMAEMGRRTLARILAAS